MDRLVLNGPDNALELRAGWADTDGQPVVVLVARDMVGTHRQVQVGLLLEGADVDRVLVALHQWREEHPS